MWSQQARAAAAAARKAKGGGRPKRANNAERAVGVRWGAEMHAQVGPTKTISKPASAKAKPNVAASMGHPPGVPVPKPPQQFNTYKPPPTPVKPKLPPPSRLHGSGTGLTSAYRYTPMAKKKRGG
jgi:hypothetical protein